MTKEVAYNWSQDYIMGYPYWKIYKDKVGSNVYASSEDTVDTPSVSASRLLDQLGKLPQGHYILQMRKKFDQQAGNMQTEFDVPYGYVPATTTGVGSIANVDPDKYISKDTMSTMLADKIAKFTSEMQAAEQAKKIKKLKKKLEKAEREKSSSTWTPDKVGMILEQVTKIAPEIRGLISGGSVGIAGFNDATPPIPTRKAPAAGNTNSAIQDPPAGDDNEPDEYDDRMYDALERMILIEGGDKDVAKAKQSVAELMEGLVGFAISNPSTFNYLKPQILDARKFYPNE